MAATQPVWVRGLVGFVVTMGFGYGIMKVTTPTDEQLYNKLSPELKKRVDAERQAASRKAAYAEQLAKAKAEGDADAPAWAAKNARDSTPPPRQ